MSDPTGVSDAPRSSASSKPTPEAVSPAGAVAKTEGEASARIAHELANLLDGGLRNVSLALASLRDADRGNAATAGIDDVVQRLDTASEAMKQMGALLRRWLTRDHGPLDLGSDSGTLGQAIAHAVRLFAGAAEPIGAQVRGRCDDAVGRLPVGPVFPVIINAVRNSIEAMRAEGDAQSDGPRVIDVSAAREGERVCISITDTGPGIDASAFDAARRFRFGVTTKPTGHGLGLTLARDVAAALGGELTVTNRSPRGAAVTLRFPADRLITNQPPTPAR
jgi:two-component system, NtrC family, sensor histidine kinase HydH